MDIEECKSAYEGLKKNAFIVESIDKEFFLKFGETVLNELDNKDDDIDILLNRIDEYEKNTMWKYEVKEILDKKDKIINEMAEVLNDFDYDKQCEICHTDICSASVDRTEYTKCIIDYFTKKVTKED